MNLTDQELRIKVAELCGWKFAPQNGPLGAPWRNTKIPAWDEKLGRWSGRADLPPDYCNDLNEMHEAEKSTALRGLLFNYIQHLEQVSTVDGVSMIWHATARQRAEALVKTLSP